MGLCIGASLLTVCEMIEFAITKIIKTVRIRKKATIQDTVYHQSDGYHTKY